MAKQVTTTAELLQFIDVAVKRAVDEALTAGNLQAKKDVDDSYKATEKRLHAYPVLLRKIENDKGKLEELQAHGAYSNSRSLIRFNRSTTRLSPEEIVEALTRDLETTIAADQYEVDTIEDALEEIQHDPYYDVIERRHLDGQTDEEIAEYLHCDPSTVRRNRGRLMRTLAVCLYGVKAL